jgi:hypothetical protein
MPIILNPAVGQGGVCGFWGGRARRNDAEWLFHSKELQRSYVPQKPYNLPCSELAKEVKAMCCKKSLWTIVLNEK